MSKYEFIEWLDSIEAVYTINHYKGNDSIFVKDKREFCENKGRAFKDKKDVHCLKIFIKKDDIDWKVKEGRLSSIVTMDNIKMRCLELTGKRKVSRHKGNYSIL